SIITCTNVRISLKIFAGYDKKCQSFEFEKRTALVYRKCHNGRHGGCLAAHGGRVFTPELSCAACLRMRTTQDVEILHTLLPGQLSAMGCPCVVEDSASGKLVAARPTTVEQLTELSVASSLLTRLKSGGPPTQSAARCVPVCSDHLSCSVDLAKLFTKLIERISFKFLVVAESHSRRGIGKRLVELSLELAAENSDPPGNHLPPPVDTRSESTRRWTSIC
uniref:N-acetyltransferase domain-containing protein n=1 Tax=Macrostomum lignano TaxID=282301 RepID=A0A1I8FRQ1_9PLAT